MNAITELEKYGYSFTLAGETIRAACSAAPDPAVVRPLLAELKQRKTEALAYLQQRADSQTNVHDLPKVIRLDANAEITYRAGDGRIIQPCYYYDKHRASYWLAAGRYICGICHPPTTDDVQNLP